MPIFKNDPFTKYYAEQTLILKGSPSEKFAALYAEAAKGREELLAVAADIANRFNGMKKVPSLKRSDVAWEKTIRGKGADAKPSDRDIAKLNDLARGSVVFTRFADVELAKEFVSKNYQGVIFDRFEDGEEESGYRDIKYLLKLPIEVNGVKTHHICELQLHMTFTQAAYGKIHPIYEITRLAGKGGKGGVKVPAKDVKDLGPKLLATYRTAKIRHMGGLALSNAFYSVIAKFYVDKQLSKVKDVDVQLDEADVKALRDMSPVINNAYYTQMQHSWVMVDGKLQQTVSSDAQANLAKIGTGLKRQQEMAKWKQQVSYIQ